MEERSSIGGGSSLHEIGAHADTSKGESPIELHLLFVPDCELNGAPRQKRGAPGAAVSEEENLGSQKDRQANGQSIFSAQPGGTVRSAHSPEVPSPNSSLARACEPRGNTFFFSGQANG
jgi:hypothetical protein